MTIEVLNKNERLILEKVFEIQMSAYRIEADILEVKTIPPLEETIEDLITSKEEVFTYLTDALPSGAIFLDRKENYVNINKLVIDPKYFRKGIGRALVQYSIDLYPGIKFKVSTGKKNTPAIKLYCSLGFKILSEYPVEDGLVIVELERG